MRISDWSSDVCSSDLPDVQVDLPAGKRPEHTVEIVDQRRLELLAGHPAVQAPLHPVPDLRPRPAPTAHPPVSSVHNGSISRFSAARARCSLTFIAPSAMPTADRKSTRLNSSP